MCTIQRVDQHSVDIADKEYLPEVGFCLHVADAQGQLALVLGSMRAVVFERHRHDHHNES